jgi:hypothetical protein
MLRYRMRERPTFADEGWLKRIVARMPRTVLSLPITSNRMPLSGSLTMC